MAIWIYQLFQKNLQKENIITLSKPEKKIEELWSFIKKQLNFKNQVFWVCPLIEESSFFSYSSVKKKFEMINKKFPNKVGLIHGALDKDEKEKILKKFLKMKFLFLYLLL